MKKILIQSFFILFVVFLTACEENNVKTNIENSKIQEACANAEKMTISDDVQNGLNTSKNKTSTMCYKVNLSAKNNGTYTLFLHLFEGTVTHASYHTSLSLYTLEGTLVHQFDESKDAKLFLQKRNLREQFTVDTDQEYYLKINRGKRVYYAMSIQPSSQNGLTHTSDNEINDNIPMAAKIPFSDLSTEIKGNLNISRTDSTSLKGSDDTDVYEIDFPTSGTYELDFNLYDGTNTQKTYYVYVVLYDKDRNIVHYFNQNKGTHLFLKNQSLKESFEILDNSKKYYLSIYRKTAQTTRYGFSIN